MNCFNSCLLSSEVKMENYVNQMPSSNHDDLQMEDFDFTFDVSSLFSKPDGNFGGQASQMKEEKYNLPEPCYNIEVEDIDFTLDISDMAPTTEVECAPETHQKKIFVSPKLMRTKLFENTNEPVMFEDFVIDHEEYVQTDTNCVDNEYQTNIENSKSSKRRSNFKWKLLSKHHIAAFSSIYDNNCEPYISSACVNEQFRWMDKRHLIKELPNSLIKKFYNVPNFEGDKISLKQEPSRECKKRLSRFSRNPNHKNSQYLSSHFKRVVYNEVVLNAEDNTILTDNDIECINRKALDFSRKIFKRLNHLKQLSSKKRNAINRISAVNLCCSLFGNQRSKRDFLGEVIHQNPKWKYGNQKGKSYKTELAIHTQLDGLGTFIKQYFYAKNKLIKDLR